MPSPDAAFEGSALVQAIERLAKTRAESLGAPSNDLEDWRYVALSTFTAFSPAPSEALSSAQVLPLMQDGADCLVLLDGIFQPQLSTIPRRPGGVVRSTADLTQAEAAALSARWMASLATESDLPTCWAHMAGAADTGVHLHISGVRERPLQLLSLSSGGTVGGVVTLQMDTASQLRLTIIHHALGAARSSLLIDITLASGAQLSVDDIQGGPAAHASQLFCRVRAECQRDSLLRWTSARMGALVGRTRFDAALCGDGASCDLASVAVISGQRQWHDLTRVEHRVGNTSSMQLYKTVADQASVGSFDGLVTIRPGADLSSAQQRNHSLLLSPKARVDSRPQLDIGADDVKASHGSSIGAMNADEILYLRTRGLDEHQARSMLRQGFIQDVTSRLCQAAQDAWARSTRDPLVQP